MAGLNWVVELGWMSVGCIEKMDDIGVGLGWIDHVGFSLFELVWVDLGWF
jgi:hypothetical protein